MRKKSKNHAQHQSSYKSSDNWSTSNFKKSSFDPIANFFSMNQKICVVKQNVYNDTNLEANMPSKGLRNDHIDDVNYKNEGFLIILHVYLLIFRRIDQMAAIPSCSSLNCSAYSLEGLGENTPIMFNSSSKNIPGTNVSKLMLNSMRFQFKKVQSPNMIKEYIKTCSRAMQKNLGGGNDWLGKNTVNFNDVM